MNKPKPKPKPKPQPKPDNSPKEYHNYKVAFRNDNVDFELESTDKKFIEEKIDLFMLQDNDDPRLEDAVRRIDAIIDDISGTKTE